MWNIKNAKQQLGSDVGHNILFIHAVLGCDTTSRVYSIEKRVLLKKFMTLPRFRDHAKVFKETNAGKESVQKAGENTFVLLLNGKPGQRVDELQ